MVRLKELPSVDEVLEFLNKEGIFDVGIGQVNDTMCDVHGRKNDDEIRHRILSVNGTDFYDRKRNTKKCSAEDVTPGRPNHVPHPPVQLEFKNGRVSILKTKLLDSMSHASPLDLTLAYLL